jgi:hypothetical protein
LKGECEAAFKCYEQCLGGQLGAIFRYGGTPLAGHVPADWSDKVMHGSLTSRIIHALQAGSILFSASRCCCWGQACCPDAWVHWFSAYGKFENEPRAIINAIPFVIFLILGLLRRAR